ILLVPLSAAVSAQTPKTCKANLDGGKYHVISADLEKDQKGNPFLDLTIEVEKDKFNEEDLVKIAQRIRETYCNENNISGFIVEKPEKKLKLDDVTPAPIFPIGTRCLYTLDRQKNHEVIGFWDAYGKPTGKPEINLSIQK